MNGVCLQEHPPVAPDNRGPCYTQKESALGRLSAFAASRDEQADVTIVTQEGDRVTLSADRRIDLTAAAYGGLAQANGVVVKDRVQLFSVEVGQQIAIQVEGDLNEQEEADIAKIFDALLAMVDDFLNGQPGTRRQVPETFSDLETIAEVSADISVSSGRVATSAESASRIARNSSFRDRGGQSAAFDPVLEPSQASLDRLTDRMVRTVRRSKLQPVHVDRRGRHFMARIMQQFQLRASPDADSKALLGRRIIDEFLRKLGELMDGVDGGPAETASAADANVERSDACHPISSPSGTDCRLNDESTDAPRPISANRRWDSSHQDAKTGGLLVPGEVVDQTAITRIQTYQEAIRFRFQYSVDRGAEQVA